MLYDLNSINHPNLMGARRSCGQYSIQIVNSTLKIKILTELLMHRSSLLYR
jgi:hypothetical protein